MKLRRNICILVLICIVIGYGTNHACASETPYFYWPVDASIALTTGFGDYDGHKGMDFSCWQGTSVYAAASGTVTVHDYGCTGSHRITNPAYACKYGTSCAAYQNSNKLGSYGGWANYIEIDHGNGYYTRYAHMMSGSWTVKTGDWVKAGTLIGKSSNCGNTAGTTGYHLHFEVGSTQNRTVRYDAYRNGWLHQENVPAYDIDTRYPSFYAYTLSTGNVECYNGINGTRAGDIWPGDRCLVEEVYTNGWCKVKCPWPDENNMKTVYVPLSVFIYDTWYVHTEHILLYGTQGYKKNNMSEGYEWLDAKTYCRRVSKVNGLTQVIAWKDGVGNHLTWIRHTGDYIEGLNIGSDFYAYIINNDQWRHVTRDVSPDGVSNVSLRKEVSDETQIWKFEYQGNGYYKIVNPISLEVLEVQGSVDGDGTNVKTWLWYNGDSELWMLCGQWNGGVTIEPKLSSLRVLDIENASTTEGANVQIWSYNGTGAQKFHIWTDLRYRIYYKANGGSNTPGDSDLYPYLTTTTLSSHIPSAPQYTITFNPNGGAVSPEENVISGLFKNWNTTIDGSGSTYYPGSSYTIHGPTVLYAQWTNPTAGALPTPTRSGHTFVGWFTVPDGGTEISADTVVTENMTLYAHWQKDSTTILGDLNLDGHVDSDDLTLLARHVAGIELLTAEAALRNADVNKDNVINSDDLTLHARYVAGIITDWS